MKPSLLRIPAILFATALLSCGSGPEPQVIDRTDSATEDETVAATEPSPPPEQTPDEAGRDDKAGTGPESKETGSKSVAEPSGQSEEPETGTGGKESTGTENGAGQTAGANEEPPADRQTSAAQEADTGKSPAEGNRTAAASGSPDKVSQGETLYRNQCAPCHGPNGKGEGPVAQTLQPQPRDHTNPDWQDSVTDEQIANVIQKGGPAIGLSATMPPFAHVSDSQVQALVDYIRSLEQA